MYRLHCHDEPTLTVYDFCSTNQTNDLSLVAFAAVTLKCPGRGELAKLMTNHIFCDQNLHVLAPIMNHKGQVNELRNDRAPTRPGFNRFLPATLALLLNFEVKLRIDVRAFFTAATHCDFK